MDGRPSATLLTFTDTTRHFALQQELVATQESLATHVEELQSSNEELETTNEELQSTNEELETTNEELQSTNEELETMNEELRSTNEELEATNEELHRRSEENASSRRYLQAVLGSLGGGVAVLDGDLRVLSWNRWNENTWGLRAEEVLGRDFFALDFGFQSRALQGRLHRALAGEDQAESVVTAVDRRGKPIRCRVRVSPLLYEERAPRGAVVAMEEVAEAERDADHNAYLGRVIDASLNEVYFLDPGTLRFLLVNRGAEAKLGHPLARLQRMSFADLLPDIPAEALKALVRPLLNGDRKELVFETRMRAADGQAQPAEIRMEHFGGETPPILVAIVNDALEGRRIQAAD